MNQRINMIEGRKSKSWLQEDVANALGITQQAISQIEQGKRTPSLKLATDLSRMYEMTIEELFPDIFLAKKTTDCNVNE